MAAEPGVVGMEGTWRGLGLGPGRARQERHIRNRKLTCVRGSDATVISVVGVGINLCALRAHNARQENGPP